MSGERIEISYPPEWTNHPRFDRPPRESQVTELWDDEGKCRGALFALRFDGVRMISLSWEGAGARFARITRESDWALEEHFRDDPPPHLVGAVDRAWRDALALLSAAAQQARRSTQPNPPEDRP